MSGDNRSLSERTATELYNMIVLQKKFSAGEKLPNENELATSLGVSRTTLREAVHYLIAQGILSVQRGRGTFISDDLSMFHKYDMGALSHARLADMHGLDHFEPGQLVVADLLLAQRPRDHAVDLAAGFERGIGDDAHQPDGAAAIDQRQAAPGDDRAHGAGALGMDGVMARARAAEDTD